MSNFWRNHFSVFFNKSKGTISTPLLKHKLRQTPGIETNQFALFRCLLWHIFKRRIDRWINGGTSHLVLCETKTKNLPILFMTICLCCVWHILVIFLSILCMTLSLTSTFSIYYIINYIFLSKKNKMSLLTGVYGRVGHHILHEEDNNRRRNNALEYDAK